MLHSNHEKRHRTTRLLCTFCALPVLCTLIAGCSGSRTDGSYYAENRTFETFDLKEALTVSFDEMLVDLNEPTEDEPAPPPKTPSAEQKPNDTSTDNAFRMRVYGKMDLFEKVGDTKVIDTLKDGTQIVLSEIENSIWAEVESLDGKHLGYAKEGFLHAVSPNAAVYAELPIEYGMAKTNEETFVEAYSHLVDVRKYLKVYETDAENLALTGVSLSDYDVIVAMQLSTNLTTIKEPFYDRNLCMLQYDIIPKLKEAIDIFKEDGYTVIIYDAYRPTGVQQRWFDVVRVHKWVADPSRGMGGVHDRGTAIDMSLIDKNGKIVDMPTPMHTFTEAAARSSAAMTDEQRKNMDYMMDVMVSCGFDYINSEWWHFQDVNTKYYLPTDHPIDEIPLLLSEASK